MGEEMSVNEPPRHALIVVVVEALGPPTSTDPRCLGLYWKDGSWLVAIEMFDDMADVLTFDHDDKKRTSKFFTMEEEETR